MPVNNKQEEIYSINNKDRKIGYIIDNSYRFSIDTIALKKEWQDILQSVKPETTFDKIEIRKDITLGTSNKEYYMVVAYDYSQNLKSARWLVNKRNTLYFFGNTNNNVDNEIFYRTYYTLYGSDTDCFPEVHYINKEYLWAGSEKLVCLPDDPCKSSSTFVPYE